MTDRSPDLDADVDVDTTAPDHTGSPATRVLGLAALATLVLWALYGLVWSPPDVNQSDAVRLFYVHVPSAILAYTGCFLTAFASGMWLRRRSRGWDALAAASAELGLVFVTITLVTGSLWGNVTWGTFWTWDARLTSTALLAVMLVGYLALRRVEISPAGSARAAVMGLLLVPNVIIVNRSVEWWRSLHQTSTLMKLEPSIEGEMLTAFAVGMLAGALVFAWLLIHRFRVAWLEQQVEQHDLEAAVAARRAEAGVPQTTKTTEAQPV
ncbi:MAG TPA: cytochrome c biogenesis protein CcsA [Acidimicrobiales bacterium]